MGGDATGSSSPLHLALLAERFVAIAMELHGFTFRILSKILGQPAPMRARVYVYMSM